MSCNIKNMHFMHFVVWNIVLQNLFCTKNDHYTQVTKAVDLNGMEWELEWLSYGQLLISYYECQKQEVLLQSQFETPIWEKIHQIKVMATNIYKNIVAW